MKRKKKLLTEIFGILEHLPAQKPTNQDSQLSWFFQIIWKTVRKSNNMGFHGIISAWKLFKNLLHSKFQKMAEKKVVLWFLELYFIWSTFPTKMIYYRGKLLLECYWKKENLTFQNKKEIHNGCTKM